MLLRRPFELMKPRGPGLAAHKGVLYNRWDAPHPRTQPDFYPSIGQNLRAREHWRLKLADGRQLHVLVWDNCYEVHWDHFDAHSAPVRHMIVDAPIATAALLVTASLAWAALKAVKAR